MGSRKCGGCLSCLLILLALWSIIVNILLYFPNGQTSYASSNKLTNYVWYFEGICFSGIMMLIVAAVLLVLDSDNNYKCCQSENCTEKYMTLLSIIFSGLGIAFSGYCLVISALGLIQGPYCRTHSGWEYAFEDTAGRFLTDSGLWGLCLEPVHVVEWNIILFSILIALSGLQVIVCLVRVVVQLSKILCGTYSVIIQFIVICQGNNKKSEHTNFETNAKPSGDATLKSSTRTTRSHDVNLKTTGLEEAPV